MDIDIAIHHEVVERCGKDWVDISTDLSNELLERCGEVESLILDIVDEFEERIREDKGD